MAELKTYVCPNCGANTTDARNCEYCGSLLVRFVEKGIDVKSISYLNSNDWVLPGLIENLKENLQLQLDNPKGTEVQTDICGGPVSISVFSPAGKIWTWRDGTEIYDLNSTDRGLIITLSFFDCRNPLGIRPLTYQSKLTKQDSYKKSFNSLESFPLFISHESSEGYSYIVGGTFTYTEYAIDFGQDAEGAARLISRILLSVYGVSRQNSNIQITTNAGESNIREAAKENQSVYTGVDKDYNRDQKWGLWLFIILAIGSIIYALIR